MLQFSTVCVFDRIKRLYGSLTKVQSQPDTVAVKAMSHEAFHLVPRPVL